MATPTEFTYPYNPNGVLDECKIISEPHTITPSSGRNYNWFVPFAGPFFGFSVVLKHVASGKTLQRGVDYNLGLEYHVFNTQVTLRPVYGAIILIDTALTGQFTVDYMTIGGQYAINRNKALELVANAQLDPRSTYWENVTDVPSQFPVTSHLHNVVDITGMAEVVEAINLLAEALTNGGGKWFQSLNEHLLDWNDPHHVLDMITGGGGEAIPKATQQQAIEGTDNSGYMTSLRVAQQIAAGVAKTISGHINSKGNVHSLTAADINLGLLVNKPMATSVDADGNSNLDYYVNLGLAQYVANQAVAKAIYDNVTNNIASQSEAELGVNNTKIMTSLRVAQQIAAGVGTDLQRHKDATGNVHNMVAADIGLGRVVNLPFGTVSDVDNNTNQNFYASLALAKYIAQKVASGTDTSSFVTLDQVNNLLQDRYGNVPNYGAADLDQAIDPTNDNTLMTPMKTDYAINTWAPSQLMGVVTNAQQRAAYLAQSTYQEDMVDTTNGEIWTYNSANNAWALNSSASITDRLNEGRVYYNRFTRYGYLCTAEDGTVVPVVFPADVPTFSTSAPPTNTSGYSEGHIWYQI